MLFFYSDFILLYFFIRTITVLFYYVRIVIWLGVNGIWVKVFFGLFLFHVHVL